MIRVRFISIALAAVLISLGTLAAEPTTQPAELDKNVQAALDQLASDDAAARQAAQDALVQIGRPALEPLRQLIVATRDVEQRTGAQAAIVRIEEQASIGATMITMRLENATPAQIVAELSKQAGIPIKYHGNEQMGGANGPKNALSINIEHQPLWAAVREVCKVTGLNITPRGNSHVLALGLGGTDLSGPTVFDGPFMVVAQSINTSSNVQLSQPGNINRNASIQFIFFGEPKLRIAQHPYAVQLTECVDDAGHSLVPQAMVVYQQYNYDDQIQWQASSQIIMPAPEAKKIARLKGLVKLEAAVKIETIEIPDILSARNVTKSAGGQTLIVKDVTTDPGGDNVTVNVTILMPPSRGNAGYALAQSIRLLDAKGQALQSGGASSGGSLTRIESKITFSKRTFDEGEKRVGDPVKLVLPIVIETRPVECNFEFKDLPLP